MAISDIPSWIYNDMMRAQAEQQARQYNPYNNQFGQGLNNQQTTSIPKEKDTENNLLLLLED